LDIMAEIHEELVNRLSAAVDKMPAFPKSVQRVLELTREDDCPLKELVSAIEADPVMTVKLLRILNSAYYNFPKKITSVNESVSYLGMNTIKNMALSFAEMQVLPQQNAAGFDAQRFLLHSLITASVARSLCLHYCHDQTNPGDCYIVGLLHDFGKVVLAQFLAPEFKQALECSLNQAITLHEAEQQVIGLDHSEIGWMLMTKWRFPEQLTETVRRHHGDISADDTMLSCLFMADEISKLLAMEEGGRLKQKKLPSSLAEYFGGQLLDVIASLKDISKLESEAHVLAQAGGYNIKYGLWGLSG